jgi:16S rRNA (cytosine1402-N4)-methyltransferase
MNKDQLHIPVMLKEVIACLKPFEGAIYVDATFGAGGYSKAILDAANCNVLGIDRDPMRLKTLIL